MRLILKKLAVIFAFFIAAPAFAQFHEIGVWGGVANYFGDLIKKEMGISAQEYIQSKLIDRAKERIFDIDKSISEIAYELGFKYPQHFTRFFKQKVGITPVEYRHLN